VAREVAGRLAALAPTLVRGLDLAVTVFPPRPPPW
jgi:hypothetical protein